MVFATLAFLGAFGAHQGLLTYFADLSGPGLPSLKRRGAPPCPAHLLSQGVGWDAEGYFSATFLILSSRTAPFRYVE